MRTIKILITIYLLINVSSILGQTGDFGIESRIPKLTNFDDITKIDNPFQVPIYEIVYKDIKIPITLTYDNTGVRINDEPSEVGLKWSLDIGTQISRKVNGLPDESEPMPYQYLPDQSGIAISNPTSFGRYDDSDNNIIWGGWLRRTITLDFSYFLNEDLTVAMGDVKKYNVETFVLHNVFDVVPDEFSYILNGTFGHFFLETNGIIRTLKKSSVKITQNLLNAGQNPFEIKDGFGNLYKFKNGNRNRIYTRSTRLEHPDDVVENYIQPYYSTFNIEQIVASDNALISFTYDTDTRYKRIIENKHFMQAAYNDETDITNLSKNTGKLVVSDNLIYDEISTPNETIDFIYEDYYDSRYAQWSFEFMPSGGNIQKKLKSIKIKNRKNKVIKEFSFDYEEYADGRIRLASIVLKDEFGNTQPYRTFGYNNLLDNIVFPYYKQDYFGYYNNNSENHLFPYSFNSYSAADRRFDAEKIKAGMLVNVTYPTGGYVNFSYTPKYAPYSFNNGQIEGNFYAGGVVLESIKYYDFNGELKSSKSYSYSGLRGYFQDEESPGEYRKIGNQIQIGIYNNYEIYSSCPMFEMLSMFGTEHSELNMFKDGAFYLVEECTIEDANITENIGTFRKEYEFSKNSFAFSKKLVKESYFTKDKASLVKEIIYDYTDDFSEENSILSVYHYDSKYRYIINESNSTLSYNSFSYIIRPRYFYYNINERLENKIIKEYDENNNCIIKEFDYTYNDYGLIESIKESKSHESSKTTKYKYPFDYVMPPFAGPDSQTEYYALNYMFLGNNQINKPIEILTYVDGDIVGGKINAFQINDENNLVTPFYESSLKIESGLCDDCSDPLHFEHSTFEVGTNLQILFTVDDHYSKDIIFDKYDENGNLLEYHKLNDVFNSYIWGYNNQYPIAQVINAGSDEIAYTSFEDGISNNNWDIVIPGFNSFNTNDSYSGETCFMFDYSFPETNTVIAFNGELDPSSSSYILSFWAKGSGSISVNSDIIANPEGNDWELFSYVINNPTAITITGGDQMKIDDLRFYPIDAQMTTYTYEPLIGVTTITNSNNKTTFYEYDSFGRLKKIMDYNGDIIEYYDYHLKNE